MLLLLAGLYHLSATFGAKPGEASHHNFIVGVLLLGGALGLVGLAWGWFDPPSPNTDIKPALFYGISAVWAAVILVFILHFGMFQIGGYDHGYMVDLGWRLLKGQHLYKDFPCTTPISFVLGSKFALQWFGISWRSFVSIMALFAVVTFAWSLFLLTRLFGRHWTTLLWAAAIQVTSPMLVSFWTYNSTADLASLLFVLSAVYWFRRPDDMAALVSYGASLLLLATMKPNVAGTLILGISAILLFSPGHRWKLICVSLTAFGLFLLFLAVNHVNFSTMIASYLSVSRRGASLVPFLQDLNPVESRMAMLVLMVVLVPAVMILSQGRETTRLPVAWIPPLAMVGGFILFIIKPGSKPVGEATIFVPVALALILGRKSLCTLSAWLPVVALLGALYGFVTNSEHKLVDMPPVLAATLLLAAEMRSLAVPSPNAILRMPAAWNRYFSFACVVLGAAGLAQGIARDRVHSIGPKQFFEYDNSHTVTDGFFKGVRCGVILDETLKEMDYLLRQNPSASVWFGPRMQWGYAAFDKPSPIHEPVQWDRAMFDASREKDFFDTFLQSRHQLLILYKNDLSGYSQEEASRIVQQYDVDQSMPALTILRLKK